MKKLMLFAIAAVAVSFASCSSGQASPEVAPAPETEPVVEEVKTVVADPVDEDSAIVDEISVEIAE